MTLAINEDCYAVDAWRRETFAPGTPADVTITERRLWAINPQDHKWRAQYLHEIPDWLAGYFGRRYEKLLLALTGVAVPIHSCVRLLEGMYCHVYAKWLLIISWPLMQ